MRPYLNHFGIFVRDLEAMERFYVSVFDMIVTDRGRGDVIQYDLVFLSSDASKHHQLVLASGRSAGGRSTVMQLSFLVASLTELRRISAAASGNGARDLVALDHGTSWSLYFKDPEDNTVEVYADTPFYVPQPHGRRLDLLATDEEIISATEARCRADPGFMPREEFIRTMNARLGASR